MTDRTIDFSDYKPQEVPAKLPREFWAHWDMCGEFMEATEDSTKGEGWMNSRSGFARHYRVVSERDL